jgi:hypothetical protein
MPVHWKARLFWSKDAWGEEIVSPKTTVGGLMTNNQEFIDFLSIAGYKIISSSTKGNIATTIISSHDSQPQDDTFKISRERRGDKDIYEIFNDHSDWGACTYTCYNMESVIGYLILCLDVHKE